MKGFYLFAVILFAWVGAANSQAGIEVKKESHGVPVQISDIKYEAIPGGFKNLSYRIKNKADKKIVAIEIWVEVSDGANLNRTPQYMDWWAHEELGLPPLGKAPGPQGLWMAAKGGGVRSISISLGAVVFADGTMVGDNAEDFRKFLMGEHLAVISQAVAVGNASKGKNLEAIRGMLGKPVESVSQRQANVLLNEALAKAGTQGLENEVRRLAALQP